MSYTNLRKSRQMIEARKPFKGNNLRGQAEVYSTGRLDTDEKERFYADRDAMTYVVTSYNTPIAWYTEENGWYRVTQKFSVSTSRHQNLCPTTGMF